MKLLGIDFGLRRIGLAVADTYTGIAFGRETIEYSHVDELIARLRIFCDLEKIDKIVIGMPYSMDDASDNHMSQEVRNFGNILTSKLQIPVEYFDERLSSRQASQILYEQGYSAKDQKGKIDTLAAQKMLEGWLASQ